MLQIVVYCSMGGLVVKQMLYEAKRENFNEFFNNTIGVVCNLPFDVLKSS